MMALECRGRLSYGGRLSCRCHGELFWRLSRLYARVPLYGSCSEHSPVVETALSVAPWTPLGRPIDKKMAAAAAPVAFT
jgi:hypothetical protein